MEEQSAGEMKEQYEAMEKELRPLDLERRKLGRKLDDLNKQFVKKSQGMASLALVFTDLSEIIYTDIFPLMKDYGFVGVLVLSEESFLGQPDCLNQEQFKELMSSGWKCMLKWDKGADPKEWLISSGKLAREFEVARPKAVYFEQEAYDSEIDSFLIRQNFSVAVHHGEENQSLISLESDNSFRHLGAIGWRDSRVGEVLYDAVAQKGDLIFTVGSGSDLEKYKNEAYADMLEWIYTYCESGELMVTDPISVLEYRRGLEANRENLKKEYEEKESELKKQIEALDKEIDEITEKYVRS